MADAGTGAGSGGGARVAPDDIIPNCPDRLM